MGQHLVPQLVARGHQVTATTTSPSKLGLLEKLGAQGVVMDGLDAASVRKAVVASQPDVIVNQMTGLSQMHVGKPDMKHLERFFATTNRLRTEGTDHLLAAAEATGVSIFIAQSFGSFYGMPTGGWVKTEEEPLDLMEGTTAQPIMAAIRHLEDAVVRAGGAALRYGAFYGPGASDDQVELVRKGMFPLVGGGNGYMSVGAPARRRKRHRPGRREAGQGRVQHRRRRACPCPRVVSLSCRVRGRVAADAGS